jgi:hypothetical protein
MRPAAPDDTLYELLPAIYRIRDVEQGYQLRSLLRSVAAQRLALTADIAHLYDNWFIETCDDDLVAHFAQLVGLELGPTLESGPDLSAVADDATWRRRQVADAIADRRRKGSFSVLEELAFDATGWPALAIELGVRLLGLQSIRMTDLGGHRLLGLGDADALDGLGSPVSLAATLPDVRRLSSHRTPGAASPTGLALWLWRLVADGVRHAPATSVSDTGQYTFDQLGRDVSLAVCSAPRAPGTPVATSLDAATGISRRALQTRLEDYYGPGRSICVYRGSELVPRGEILVADLGDWRTRTPRGFVSIDPELGRIALPGRFDHEEGVWVTYARLGMGAIGGGQYERPVPPAPAGTVVYRVGQRAAGVHRSIAAAVQAWLREGKHDRPAAAVIEIVDDGVYEERFSIELEPGERLEIRAAQGRRPVLVATDAHINRPDHFRVTGVGEGDREAGDDREVAAGPARDSARLPVLVLDGIWIAGHALVLDGRLGGVKLRHCTLVPAGGLADVDARQDRRAASLVVRAMPCPVAIVSSVVGHIRVESPEAGFDPIPLTLSDSVLAAADPDDAALLGADGRRAWANLSLQRVTVLGGAAVHRVELVEDSILTGALDCERRQSGTVRFSYLPERSRTPRRTACQPDDVLGAIDAAIAHGDLPASERERRRELESTRVAPRFDSVSFGDPAYARLAASVAPELAGGAHDEGEMGAYHNLWPALRVADLHARLQEFVPAGTDFDIRFAT